MHLRSTLRRALLLANRSTPVVSQCAPLGHAAPSHKLQPAENKKVVVSPYSDCQFHDMTLTQKMFQSAMTWPDKIALVFEKSVVFIFYSFLIYSIHLIGKECGVSGRRYTYNTMSQAVRRFGSSLSRMGFRKGDVMAIVSPNSPEFPIALYGASGTGMPVALVNPTFTPGEFRYHQNP